MRQRKLVYVCLYDFSGIASCNAVFRYIFSHYSIGCYDGIVAYRHSFAYSCKLTYPHIAAYMYWLVVGVLPEMHG